MSDNGGFDKVVRIRGSMRLELPFDKVEEIRDDKFQLYTVTDRTGYENKIAVYEHNRKERSLLSILTGNFHSHIKIEISETKGKKLMKKFRKKIKERKTSENVKKTNKKTDKSRDKVEK